MGEKVLLQSLDKRVFISPGCTLIILRWHVFVCVPKSEFLPSSLNRSISIKLPKHKALDSQINAGTSCIQLLTT